MGDLLILDLFFVPSERSQDDSVLTESFLSCLTPLIRVQGEQSLSGQLLGYYHNWEILGEIRWPGLSPAQGTSTGLFNLLDLTPGSATCWECILQQMLLHLTMAQFVFLKAGEIIPKS